MPERQHRLWSGRMSGAIAPLVDAYTASLLVDRRLWREDIAISRAHARMLRGIGILSAAEHRGIDAGLRAIGREFETESFVLRATDEDIHTAVERRLYELAGDVAGKLHSGRSRNDQVATDLRLWAKRACLELMRDIADLQEALVARAREHRATLLPGYTHGQRAQVVSLGHHLLAYVEMLQRDVERIASARRRTDVLTLGSGALAGSTLPLDREQVRDALGFAAISANSMDAVSDRDFAVEITVACALVMVHVSRLCEELILWSSAEYGFAELNDEHATGSSLMPQKKNPDVAELARGRSARVTGDLVTLLTMLKGLPLTYNRDLQEDKRALFDAVDTAASTLQVLTAVLAGVRFNTTAMRAAASDSSLMATDIAEYLVQRGVPFRDAHAIVGRAVAQALRDGRELRDLTVREWTALHAAFDADVLKLFNLDDATRRRELAGGPGPRSVSAQLRRASALIATTRRQAASRAVH